MKGRYNAIGSPLVMVGRSIKVTPDRFTEIDPDSLATDEREAFDSLVKRGLIRLHPSDAGVAAGTDAGELLKLRERVQELERRNADLEAELEERHAELGRPGAAVAEGTPTPKDEGKTRTGADQPAFTEPAPGHKTTKKGH